MPVAAKLPIELAAHPASVANAAVRSPATSPAAQAVLRTVATLMAHTELRAGLAAVAALLARDHGCSRVAIALLNRDRKLMLRVVSDATAEASLNGESWLDLLTAQEECHDQGLSIRVPPPPNTRPGCDLAHGQLLRANVGQSVCSVPLAVRSQRLGVLTLQRASGEPFTAETLGLLEHVAAFLCPIVALKQELELPWVRRALREVRQTWWGTNRRLAVAVIATAVLAAFCAGFTPIAFDVRAPARLEGLVQRALAAPRDGFLVAVYVRPGDAVKAGQVLAEFDRENLELEQRRWQNEVSKAEGEFGEALAARDRAKVVVGQARIAAAAAELARVTRDLERAILVAPFDGIVLEGDLSSSVGAPLDRGQPLMTIAPAQGYRLILRVAERDIAHVMLGQSGRLVLAAHPGDALAIKVSQITPLATARDGVNGFDVEALVLGNSARLRPGLEGVARLPAGERSFYSVAGSRAYDWLRLKLWAWLG
jgi:multidrug efflux pump subunit AcrA (membrane-fusion protein)